MQKYITLKPILTPAEELEKLEKEILKAFEKLIYKPLMKDLKVKPRPIANAKPDAVIDALRKARIRYDGIGFVGKFSASVSQRLKDLGAVYDKGQSRYVIARTALPPAIDRAIDAGERRYRKLVDKVNGTIAKILPEKISRIIESVKVFEDLLIKTEKDFEKSLGGMTITPKLSAKAKARIAEEWRDNLDLYIKDFMDSEITKLRKAVQKSTFAGNRFESLVSSIQKSYGVSQRKAHFLARQETNLLLAKYKETRYVEAGIPHYKWACVLGSPKHPVRPSHKILEGKIFRWDDPPITTEKGQPVRRNNPGQDYGCRCLGIPVLLKGQA